MDIDLMLGGSVGLAANPRGVQFKCGTCEYFKGGICHHRHKALNGRKVSAEWCCNLYDNPGMRQIA